MMTKSTDALASLMWAGAEKSNFATAGGGGTVVSSLMRLDAPFQSDNCVY